MSRGLIKGACIKLTYSSCAASSASVPSDLKALYKSVIIIIIIIILPSVSMIPRDLKKKLGY